MEVRKINSSALFCFKLRPSALRSSDFWLILSWWTDAMDSLPISVNLEKLLGCSEIEQNIKSPSKHEYSTSLKARPTSGFFVSFFPSNQMTTWYGEDCSHIFILFGQMKLLSTVPDSEFMQKLLSLQNVMLLFFFQFCFKTCIFKVHLPIFSLSASFTVRNMKHSMFAAIWQWFSPKTVLISELYSKWKIL